MSADMCLLKDDLRDGPRPKEMGRACIHLPRELYLERQTVVEIWEGNAILRTHWLSNDDLVDIIELIPILVPGKTISTLIST